MNSRFLGAIAYKDYHILYNPKPIPDFRFDYDFWHDGYDGAIDSGDIRIGTGGSVEDCMKKIDELLESMLDAELDNFTQEFL